MSTVTFKFPLPPNRGNQTWGQGQWDHQRKKRWFKLADAENAEIIYANKCGWPLKKAVWKSVCRVRGWYDFDNLVSLHKWPCDWIKTIGIVANDNKKNLWPMCLPEQFVSRKEAPMMTITLYERAE